MRTVYKYVLDVTDEQGIQMPVMAKILSVAEDHNGDLCVWAAVIPDNRKEEVLFRVIGTGNPISLGTLTGWQFLGTTVMSNGLVWHVWYRQSQ